MQLKKREVEQIFNKLKLQVKPTHHKIASLYYNGKFILTTRLSFGRGDIPGHITDKIRGQLHLNEEKFRDLVNCPLDYDGYITILKEKGIIS
jgi:hypothetical protein